MYIGLFDPDSDSGDVGFFDVQNPPPRNGTPRSMLTLRELVDELDALVGLRNENVFVYDDGASDEVDITELTVEDITGDLEEDDEPA